MYIMYGRRKKTKEKLPYAVAQIPKISKHNSVVDFMTAGKIGKTFIFL